MNIFLSPSNQTANVGAYSNTNECEQCERIAKYAYDYLIKNYDCNVEIAASADNMNKRCEEAKAFGANLYLAIHTNAFNETVRGTETYYHSGDTEGKKFAAALLDKVSALTECKRRTIANDSLIELNTPTCTRAYIEVDFHSNPERAAWIVENAQKIGETIAECIVEQYNLPKRVDTELVYIIEAVSGELTPTEAEKVKSELEAMGFKTTLTAQMRAIEGESEKETTDDTENIDTELSVGDKVKLAEGAPVYGKEYGFSEWVYNATLYVRQINGSRIVVSTVQTGAVTGAVDKKYIIKM